MSAEFYLFDVDHGQSAALYLPNGRWCIFDVGCTGSFSPIELIAAIDSGKRKHEYLSRILQLSEFKFWHASVSHLHGDHLADWPNLKRYDPEYISTVEFDKEYLNDCKESSDPQSWHLIKGFTNYVDSEFRLPPLLSFNTIREKCLTVEKARQIGGNTNSRVNNASIITRINVYNISILICGDLEKNAWEYIINNQWIEGFLWRSFLKDIDILIAPHHGHKSAFSVDLLKIAKPVNILISVESKDPHVDSRYSIYNYISTRQSGHIKVKISPPNTFFEKGIKRWYFGNKIF